MNHLELPASYASRPRVLKVAARARIAMKLIASRVVGRRTFEHATRLHLGSGDHILNGWANVDALALPGVTPWDLRKPLPVEPESIDYIFSEHFIEHITLNQTRRLLTDCHRVLRRGGIIRLSTPDLAKIVEQYVVGRTEEWTDVNWHPATPAQMVNEAVRQWGHLFIFDEAELFALLNEIGFSDIARVAYRSSEHASLRGLECRPDHGELIVEAVK